jgi:hypothetical protein
VIGVATSNVNFDVLMNYAFYDCRACATHHLSNMTPSNLITQPLLMYSSAAAAKKKGEVSTDDEVVKGWERLKGVARVSFTGFPQTAPTVLAKKSTVRDTRVSIVF